MMTSKISLADMPERVIWIFKIRFRIFGEIFYWCPPVVTGGNEGCQYGIIAASLLKLRLKKKTQKSGFQTLPVLYYAETFWLRFMKSIRKNL